MIGEPLHAARGQVPYSAPARGLDGMARHIVLGRLRRLGDGCVELLEGGERHALGRPDGALRAAIRVHDARFYSEVAFGGSIGAGESYMRGDWSCEDLTALGRIMLRNREVLDDLDRGLLRIRAPLQKALHWLSRNTRGGSRRNIAAHYDLGNDFFRLWLDGTMMYSSAIFERPDMTLEEASQAKVERVCRKLQLAPGDEVLEIGTGWGGFALHAAGRYGCRVTTTTLSREQYELAAQRVQSAGLQDRITLLQADYRDLRGSYDKLVSIEMIEAVGHEYYDRYFATCSRLLRPAGMMLLQAITIADQRYEQARRSVDFIQRHIFPGGCIPSVAVMTSCLARVTDMRLFNLEDIGPHYATTLRRWRERLFARLDAVRALGYPDEFLRMWEFYLCYCEAGFIERSVAGVQMLLVKPQNRREVYLGS